MNLELLSHFLVFAEDMSLTRAAGRLYLTQSTLSRQMAELERQLGVRLFVREKNAIRLTPTGQRLAETGQELLDHAAGLRAELERIDRRQTRPALAVCTFSLTIEGFSPVFGAYHDAYPDVDVSLHPAEPDEILALVGSGRCDLGFTTSMALGRLSPEARGALSARFVRRDELRAVVSAAHPLAGRASVRWEELADYRLVMPLDRSANEGLADVLRAHGLDPERIEKGENRVLRFAMREYGAVALILGGAFLDVMTDCVALPIEDCGVTAELYYVWRSGRTRPETRRYLDLVELEFGPASGE